jgi:hypothetical protein
MKNFSYLTTLAATAITVAIPVTAGAQGIFQSVPSSNPASTTIYAPPIDSMSAPAATTTTPSVPNGYTTNFNSTTTTVSPGAYPGNHTFGKFSNYGSFSRYKNSNRNGRGSIYQNSKKQNKMILNPNPMYPGFSRPNTSSGNYGNYGRSTPSNSCSTSVIGSPIPSAVPLDRSGRPCN